MSHSATAPRHRVMSIFAIIGGTGTIGSAIVSQLEQDGHEVRVLSRSAPDHPVDLTTGAGLDAALAGVDVVVDASNAPPNKATPLLVDAQPGLLAAEQTAGVKHHVCISIVGIDEVPTKYYKAKVGQEQAVRAGQVPFTIVRITQFHEFVAWGLNMLQGKKLAPKGKWRIQPIAAAEAAAAVARVATGEPVNGIVTVAGPEVHDFTELAQLTSRKGLPLPLRVLPKIEQPLRAGALTTDRADHHGTTTFAQWLTSKS